MFISPAFASSSAAGPDSFLVQMVPMLIIGVLFWFLLIRPQQKRAKEHAVLLNTLQKGDEVQLSSGILARVSNVDEAHFWLELADGVEVVVLRGAVTAKMEPGTLKKLGR